MPGSTLTAWLLLAGWLSLAGLFEIYLRVDLAAGANWDMIGYSISRDRTIQ